MAGKMKRWSTGWALVLVASLLVSTLTPLTARAGKLFAVGEGTEQEPYIISTSYELNNIRHEPEAYFKLGADIDLSSIEDWDPIEMFHGSLDGAGHAISGLKSIRPEASEIGLFGQLNGNALVTHLDLLDVELEGNEAVGGVTGRNGGMIRDVHVTGKITGVDQTGGIAGASHGSVFYSSFEGSVTGETNTGGLVGNNITGIYASHAIVQATGGTNTGGLVGNNPGGITESYAVGEVSGSGDNIGGIAGNNQTGYIGDAYAQVAVSTETGNNVGGLAGTNNSGWVENSYAAGPVSGLATSIGGLIGRDMDGNINRSYYDEEITGQSDNGMGEGRSTAHMRMESNYGNWDFDTIWTIREGVDYPTLRIFGDNSPDSTLEGSGTEEDPYIITTADELSAIGDNVIAYYRLGNDIDLSHIASWGCIDEFAGTFDGDGHIISGLAIGGGNYQGLFCRLTDTGVIANLGLADVNVNGNMTVGGLVGDSRGTILNSFVTGHVSGQTDVGGFVGFMHMNATIKNSYAMTDVTAFMSGGGLVGSMISGLFEHVYVVNTAEVQIGPGGLVGAHNMMAEVRDSYYNTDTLGFTAGIGQGKTTAELQSPDTFVEWDEQIWLLATGEYPKLRIFAEPIENQPYTVSYDGNGHTSGQAPPAQMFEEGQLVQVALPATLFRADHLFVEWNTEQDGSGTPYEPGDEFTMGGADVTLYAQWQSVLKGDGNFDGMVTPADALLLAQAMEFKVFLSIDQHSVLDMDDDGDLTDLDLQLLMEAYQGMPVPAAPSTVGTATVEIGQVSGMPGELVSVPLVLKEATAGVAAYGIELEYDPRAFFLDDVWGHGASLVVNEKPGLMQLAWVDRTGGDSPITPGETMLTLVFQIRDDAVPGNRTVTVKQAQDGGNLHFQSTANRAMDVIAIDGRMDILQESKPVLSAIPGPRSAKLSWTPWPKATAYTVYYGIEEDHLIGSDDAETAVVAGTSLTLQELRNGTTYYIVVEAELSTGEKVSSNIVKVMPDSTDVNSLQGILDQIYAQMDELPDGDLKDELMEMADDYQLEIGELLDLESKVNDLPSYTILYQKMTQLGKGLFELQIAIVQFHFSQLQDDLEQLEGNNATLEAEAVELKQQLAELNERLEELQGKVQALESSNASLGQQLQSLNQEVSNLQGQIEALNGIITNLQNENEQLKQEKAALQEQIAGLEEQVEALQAAIEGLEGDKIVLQGVITGLNEQVDALKGELEELQGNRTELAQQLAELQVQASGLQTALNQAAAFTGDLLALQIGFADGDAAERVTRGFTLPATGAGGTGIVWSTPHDDYVTIVDGTAQVKRPAYTDGDAFVTLTATLALGELTGTVSQLIRIVKAEPTDAEAVMLAEQKLAIQFADGDSLQGVTRQLGLPERGLHGTEIIWASSHPELISDTGAVVRPAHDQANEWVMLNAHISRGDVTETKVFVVQVLRIVQTAEEAVEAAKAALALELAPGDKPNAIRGSIQLPLSGTDGTTITWRSSNGTIISPDGTVHRPTTGQGNQTVTLTASIAKDGVAMEKAFDVTVLAFASGKPVELVTQGAGLGIQRDRSGIRATVEANRRDTAQQPEKAVVVFQLMRGNESIAIVAFEKEQLLSERATAGFFSVNGNDASYYIKVYVYDELTTDETAVQTSLAEVAELR